MQLVQKTRHGVLPCEHSFYLVHAAIDFEFRNVRVRCDLRVLCEDSKG